MNAVERDPAGLLERVPELARLASLHPSLRRAIERGRPHAVYRALFWLRMLGKAGPDAQLIGELLGHRRLFIQPLNGAPAMVTYNGFGSSAYGGAEPDVTDGTYILTVYFVAIFVPLYPFSSYLVRRADKGWSFFGKVPLSATCYFWQRSVALAGVVAVLFGAVNAFEAMRYNTVQLANGLSKPVEVKVGLEKPVLVASNDVKSMRTKVGVQDVRVTLDGREIERGKFEVKRGYDVNAWNVLGAGALFQSDVVYTAKGTSAPPSELKETRFRCGERAILQDDIDFAFTEPPASLSMGEHEKVTHRSHFGLAPIKPGSCVFQLAGTGKMSEAKSLAQRVLPIEGYEFSLVARLSSLFNEWDERAFASELVNSGRSQHDDMIEYHRLYQTQEISAGRRAAILEEYRERAHRQPDSADATYLYGRLLTGPEGDRFITEAQRRFPQHAYLLRSAAFRALSRGDFAEVQRLIELLRTVDPKIWQSSLDLELRALAAMGKVEQARALAGECLKSPGLDLADRFDIVVAGTLLTHFEPKSTPTGYLDLLQGDDSQETQELRLHARVSGCEPVKAQEVDGLEDRRLKAKLELELLARSNPKAALDRVASGSDKPPGITPVTWALLLTEAARLDEHHAALSRLVRWSPGGESSAAALIQYALHGKLSDDLEDFDPEVLAAADFVHSRSVPEGSSESRALRERATHQDSLHGAVSIAMASWSP
ncbi:MAG TPA: hypothetical protein VER11_25480 [Polyangiaceae bacterium]|nr:hypothetical protein [Polyangiaceae bacterium]